METIYSANTEVTVCQACTDGLHIITPPHPNYSNLTGGTVVQMNMITLGGMHGLNS